MESNKLILTPSKGVGVWEHFTMRDGLPDMKIECVYEDGRGILWIGTHDRGVVRYDGDVFESFTRKDGVAGDGVFSVIEDDEGCIWLGTNMGLSRYDGHQFETLDIGGPQRFLWGSCKDKTGNLWFAVEGSPGEPPKVYKSSRSGVEEIYLSELRKESRQSINDINVDDHGLIWFGGLGLYCLDQNEIVQCLEFTDKIGNIISILPMKGGDVWFTADTGFYSYSQDAGLELLMAVRDDGLRGTVSLNRDGHGNIWGCSNLGFLYRVEEDQIEEVSRINASIWLGGCCDSIGRLWLSTYGMGLYCYDETRVKVYNVDHGLPSNQVNAVAKYHNGPLYAGTSSGLIKYNGTAFEDVSIQGMYDKVDISSLLAISTSELWIGGRYSALWRMEGADNWQLIELDVLERKRISQIAKDGDSRIWFGSRVGSGFGYYNEGELLTFTPVPDADYPTWIGALEVASDGKIWLGSSSPATWDGICIYDGQGFSRFSGLEGASVLALLADREERMWIGTNEGVVICDGDQQVILNQDDGLSCDLVTSICEGIDGVIVIGTEGGGVCNYDGQVMQSLQITNDPGANVIHDALVDSEGILWAGTESGLVRYRPRKIRPFVEIAKVVAGGEYDGRGEVSFSSTVGRISFYLKGRSPLERSEYLVYRYYLDGYESDWRQTSERQVDYPQLEPGEYVFKVQAVDRDLNYSEPAETKVVVTEDLRIAGLNEALRSASASGDFIGESPTIRQIKRQIKEVAWTDLTVLILGETGTGKGLAVRAIHEMSDRRDKPFLQVNCGSVQGDLFDSELFGHERGAFTGAIARKLGKFELADKGTIFLDEIGDLPLESQTRLLNVLQEQTIERVGSTQPIKVNVRVIAATNRNLTHAVREGAFREDLYYRLNVIPIEIPPLRERKEDIPLLAKYFVRQFAAHLHQQQPFINEIAMQVLVNYDWPGNVRELEHTLQRAVILSGENGIMPEHIALGPIQSMPIEDSDSMERMAIVPLDEYEKLYLERVLEHTGGVIHGKKGAAYLLGMKPTTLRSRLDKLGVEYRKARV